MGYVRTYLSVLQRPLLCEPPACILWHLNLLVAKSRISGCRWSCCCDNCNQRPWRSTWQRFPLELVPAEGTVKRKDLPTCSRL